jgi:general stress protein YciG
LTIKAGFLTTCAKPLLGSSVQQRTLTYKRIDKMASKQEHSSGSDEKAAAGEKGVTQEQVGSGKKNDPNNFANNPERASAAGRKGGHQSHKND